MNISQSKLQRFSFRTFSNGYYFKVMYVICNSSELTDSSFQLEAISFPQFLLQTTDLQISISKLQNYRFFSSFHNLQLSISLCFISQTTVSPHYDSARSKQQLYDDIKTTKARLSSGMLEKWYLCTLKIFGTWNLLSQLVKWLSANFLFENQPCCDIAEIWKSPRIELSYEQCEYPGASPSECGAYQ